jgi:hypothetical protein
MSDSDETPGVFARQEFECPGDLASVAASREQIMHFVCQRCSDEAEQIDILVALQEALANAPCTVAATMPRRRFIAR